MLIILPEAVTAVMGQSERDYLKVPAKAPTLPEVDCSDNSVQVPIILWNHGFFLLAESRYFHFSYFNHDAPPFHQIPNCRETAEFRLHVEKSSQ
jgi:hypothetical protein